MLKKWNQIIKLFKTNKLAVLTYLLVAIGLFIIFIELGLFNRLEALIYDLKVYTVVHTDENLQPDKDIIIIFANDKTFRRLEELNLDFNRWPWPRDVLAEALEFIAQCEPRAMMFFFQIDISQDGDKDTRILQAISKFKHFYSTMIVKGYRNIEMDKFIQNVHNKQKDPCKVLGLSQNRCDSLLKQEGLENVARLIYEKFVQKHIKVKIPQNLTLSPGDVNVSDDSSLIDSISFCRFSNIPEPFANVFTLIANPFINLDADNIVRSYKPLYRFEKDGSYIPSLALAPFVEIFADKRFDLSKNALTVAGKDIPLNKEANVMINYRYNFSHYQEYDLLEMILIQRYLEGKMTAGQTGIENIEDVIEKYKSIFKGKYIILGIDRDSSNFTLFVPTIKPMNRLQITANVLDNYLNCGKDAYENFITPLHWLLTVIITVLTCFFTIRVLFILEKISHKLIIMVFGIVIYVFIAFKLFAVPSMRLDMPVVLPVFFIIFSFAGAFFWQYKTVYLKRNEIDKLFGKFVSPQVKNILLEDPSLINYEGQKKIMTVLFSDLRGFTSISEAAPITQVMSQLNQYMYEMVNIIINECNGTLDKFIGDAIMAFWNDPILQNNHAALAVKAAVRMTERLNELNQEWASKGWPELRIGIGINTGEMLVGHLGGGIILDYTVIGDNVNIASRLESINKEYSTTILISETTYEMCKDSVNARFVAQRQLKGKSNEVIFFEVLSLKD